MIMGILSCCVRLFSTSLQTEQFVLDVFGVQPSDGDLASLVSLPSCYEVALPAVQRRTHGPMSLLKLREVLKTLEQDKHKQKVLRTVLQFACTCSLAVV